MDTVVASDAHFRQFQKALRRLAARVGGDFDDYYSEAQLLYLKAVQTYNASLGASFNTHLHTVVRNGLVDRYRKVKRATRGAISLYGDVITKHHHPNRLSEFLEGLSESAREVIELVIDTPPDIFFGLREHDRRHGETDNWRATVYELLRDLDWTPREIAMTFKEIADALREEP